MEKKKIVISSITVAVLLVLVVASTYAYFQARIASSGQTSTSVGAKTLDSFAINTGSDISLIANQDNFALGKGDLSSSTTASVTFTARNDEASSYAYYAGFYIKNNGFVYSLIGDEDKGLGIIPTEQTDLNGYRISTNEHEITSGQMFYNFSKGDIYDISGKTFDLILRIPTENSISIDNSFLSSQLLNQDYTAWNECGSHIRLEPTLNHKIKIETSDGTIYYKYSFTMPENVDIYPAFCGLTNYWYIVFNTDFEYYNASILIDKSSSVGQSYTELPYIQGTPELELTIKKNGEIVGTYDITNASSGDYIKFKEYDEDEVNEVYNNAMNQCMLTGLVRIDPVKYATIEACGDDLDCGVNAYQEIVGACNGDEDCVNLIYADVDQLSPACDEKAGIEADKVRGYGISANAGATTTDTWEAIVTFKNLDGNQNINAGKSFEGYFQIYSYKDFSSNEIKQSNFEKCMQKWYPSFDIETDYNTFVSETFNGNEECKNQIDKRIETCNTLWR